MHAVEVELEKKYSMSQVFTTRLWQKESPAHCNRSLTNSDWMVDVLQT